MKMLVLVALLVTGSTSFAAAKKFDGFNCHMDIVGGYALQGEYFQVLLNFNDNSVQTESGSQDDAFSARDEGGEITSAGMQNGKLTVQGYTIAADGPRAGQQQPFTLEIAVPAGGFRLQGEFTASFQQSSLGSETLGLNCYRTAY